VEPTYQLARAVLKPWLAAWFRWTIEGLEEIPTDGPALLAFNHIAYMDPFAAAYVVDRAGRRPRFLAKSELFADRKIAWVLKGARQIEVRRGTRDAPMALDHALAALDAGEIIVVFPEGTVTADPDLNPMAAKSGAARLALQSGAPLIPCALWGTANVWPKGYAKHWWPPRQDLLARVGEPLDVTGDPSDPAAWRTLSRRLMEEIAVLVASLRPAIPDRRRPKKRAA
jgi:1-acyl-sn-glycerol-3-phosphate acyltransferase